MASVEERFQAAVNVIKGLPKNGPYQPSTAMMLKFYGYYKQATEGPCSQKRPGFWDVVGKAKWDAWNDNRHLTKQQAMERYVDSLREIIETMSFTENVQNFVGSIEGLDNINLDELDMVVPGMRELAESHPNSPFNSRTNSPRHGTSANGSSAEEDELLTNGQMNGEHVIARPNPIAPTNLQALLQRTQTTNQQNSSTAASAAAPNQTKTHHAAAAETTTTTTSNTSEFNQPQSITATTTPYATSNGTVDQSDDEYADPVDMNMEYAEAMQHNNDMLKQIQATVLRMNTDLITVNQRMNNLEKVVNEVRTTVTQKASKHSMRSGSGRSYPAWWPFAGISPLWFTLLVLWPFVVRRLSRVVMAAPRRK